MWVTLDIYLFMYTYKYMYAYKHTHAAHTQNKTTIIYKAHICVYIDVYMYTTL